MSQHWSKVYENVLDSSTLKKSLTREEISLVRQNAVEVETEKVVENSSQWVEGQKKRA